MWLGAPLGQEAQRCAIGRGGQHGAGGEVDAQADDIAGVDAALPEDGRDGMLEYFEVVIRIL